VRIAFITQQTPYGKGEGFVIEELIEFARQGHDITIFPMRPEAAIYHSDAKTISARAMVMPLLTCSLALLFLKFMVSRPSEFLHVAATLLQSRNLGILIKNLLVLPKAIWIAQQVKTKGIEHIHAYWASTSATAAMVASYLTGVAWSITCYRGDIGDNNLLALKHQSAKFIRCPDEQSREEIVAICKLQNRDKLHLIRSGCERHP